MQTLKKGGAGAVSMSVVQTPFEKEEEGATDIKLNGFKVKSEKS